MENSSTIGRRPLAVADLHDRFMRKCLTTYIQALLRRISRESFSWNNCQVQKDLPPPRPITFHNEWWRLWWNRILGSFPNSEHQFRLINHFRKYSRTTKSVQIYFSGDNIQWYSYERANIHDNSEAVIYCGFRQYYFNIGLRGSEPTPKTNLP